MRSPEEQLRGLVKLAKTISACECNTAIHPAGSDVAFLSAVDTPRASQIVYASGGYDVWAWSPSGHKLQKPDLSIEDAATVVIMEYFTAKAARIKQLYPDKDIKEIMARLIAGYQNKKMAWVVTAE